MEDGFAMSENSPIEWTDNTFNPWWGCVKVSPGCNRCYAETWANRYGHDVWGKRKARRFFSDNHWNQPLKWDREAQANNQRIRVFCASMADVFEDNPVLDDERNRLWELIERTPNLDWQLLTKRPENMRFMAPWEVWPSNIWAMTSIENQEMADQRLPQIANVRASVKALSVEPLIGPVDLTSWLHEIDWVIVGGESGPKARPMHPDWARSVRSQCQDAGVAFFFKQWGVWAPEESASDSGKMIDGKGYRDAKMVQKSKKSAGRLLDGLEWNELPSSRELLVHY